MSALRASIFLFPMLTPTSRSALLHCSASRLMLRTLTISQFDKGIQYFSRSFVFNSRWTRR
jgi:hypothetical protein